MISRRTFTQTLLATAIGERIVTHAMAAPPTPLEILLIRHGEEVSLHPDEHLNDAGRARAQRLIALFPAVFATPDVLIAAKSSKGSHRSVETLTPLAAALHLDVDARFDDSRYRDLGRDLLSKSRYAGKHVLVCWHHSELPKLAVALGASGVPTKWPDEEFGRVWQLRYTAGSVKFADLPQSR